ncbi:MAG TPA: hypothetical protein VF785_03025 [Gemmatimonadaceae bacterium]
MRTTTVGAATSAPRAVARCEPSYGFRADVSPMPSAAFTTELSAFKAFTADIKERCEEPPVTAKLTEVGSYEFFGELETRG